MAVAARMKSARIALGENPGRGYRIESAVFPELRAVMVKKSLVCYQILPDRVQTVRILDARLDTWTILKRSSNSSSAELQAD
jgi:hypothetical protein